MTLLFALTAFVTSSADEPTFVNVFSPHEQGYASIRIPSLIVTQAKSMIAFAEGRDGTSSDQANNKIILKISHDNGNHWGTLRVLEDAGSDSLNNPCALVDQSNGRIWLMYQRIPHGYSEGSANLQDGYSGPGVYRSYATFSNDDGITWAPPIDVTSQVKRPAGVKTICSGPGIGIQLTRGRHKGRLLFPFNEGPFYRWNNYAVYSDDHGQTWQTGSNVPDNLVTLAPGKIRSQINEVQFAELSDGSVILNSRQFAGAKVRKSSISKDGGETWTPVKDVPELRDPSCMGSIFRFEFGRRSDKGLLLYTGPNSTARDHGTISMSHDDGRTWPVSRLLFPGEFAYSVLTKLPNGNVGCLFETENYNTIRLAQFPLSWLESKKQ